MQLKDVSASYMVACIIAVSVFFLKYLPISYWIILPLQIIVGCIVCLMVCEMIKLSEYIEIKRILLNFLRK
jgi:hypothetical protein